MSENKETQDKTDEELSALLDQTLGEFAPAKAPPARTTDDELDELMAPADQAAAQKAAKDFQVMLEQMVTLQEEAYKKAEQAPSADGESVDPNDPAAREMIETLKHLMECSSTVANANSTEEFMAGLDALRSPNSPMEPFMNLIMETLASKEVMYPPLKEIFDNYPQYLKDHGESLDKETKERYEKQFDLLGKICAQFENEPDLEAAPQLPEASTEPAAPGADVGREHFEKLGLLLVELQQYGYPPQELVGNLPEGWSLDDSGLPKVADVAAASAENCSIM